MNLDYFLTDFFSKLLPHNQFFNSFFSFFSLKGSSILIWILVIFIAVILEERKKPGISRTDKKFLILFSLSFLLTAFLSDIVLKYIFLRPRPFLSDSIRFYPIISNFICPVDFSFPSAHATTAFASAIILSFFDRKKSWFYYIIAVLISYSRIYLGCHYFADVFFGAILGFLISKIILFIYRKK